MKRHSVLSIGLVFLFSSVSLLSPLLVETIEADPVDTMVVNDPEVIVVALTLQKWDYMDYLCYPLFICCYNARLREIEREYDVSCKLLMLWDWRLDGDVQGGMLDELGVDVLIGPGGVGSLNTPRAYRTAIRQYIRDGGGFIGVCGDSYLCTGGAINYEWRTTLLLLKMFGYPSLSPALRVTNLRSDAKAICDVVSSSFLKNNIATVSFLAKLLMSNAEMYIPADHDLPFGNSLKGEKISVMTGMTPLVDGPEMFEWMYPEPSVIGIFGESFSPYYELDLMGKYAMVATTYGDGHVVASPVHSEISPGRTNAHRLFNEAVLWAGGFEDLL